MLFSTQTFAIFAEIAARACGCDKESVIGAAQDWEAATSPAWSEMKVGIAAGVAGSPKHVIDGKIVADTDSGWGVAEWKAKLALL